MFQADSRYRRLRLEPLEIRAVPTVYNVTTGGDTGGGSLRQAISFANANVGPDTITFSGLPIPAIVTLTSGTLTVSDDLVIDGSNLGTVTVTAAGFGVFAVNNSSPTQIGVTFQNLFITNGATTGNGGGINVSGNEIVTLDSTTVHKNQASVYGGGIYVAPGGQLTVRESTISGNYGIMAGGGLYLYDAKLDIVNSTIQDNISTNGAGVTLARTLGLAPNWTITNSTISGNANPIGGPGGGILAYFDTGTLNIRNSTVSNNKANPAGEIHVIPLPGNPTYGTIYLESTIVGNATSGTLQDISAPIVTAKASWIGKLAGVGTFNNAGGNVFGNVVLAPLAPNGGPTWTHALMPGSAAIDIGTNPLNLLTDQRGSGYPRQSGSGVDIGAYERQLMPPTASVQIDDNTGQRSMIQSLVVNFSEPVNFTGPAAGAITLQRLNTSSTPTPSGPVTLTFSPATGPASSFTITFSDGTFAPLFGSATSLIDGQYQLVLNASQIQSASTGMSLDGDGNGVGGDSQTVSFHRLFGDVNGDGFTDLVDFVAFRAANGSTFPGSNYNQAFDSNGDGFVDLVDLVEFRNRLGMTP